jgi:RimJ/RimL family protein N-acetyltransferase
MLMNARIETERMVMRNLQADDVTQDYADWMNDSEINLYLESKAVHQTVESCREYARSFAGVSDRAVLGMFLKEVGREGFHIGNATFSRVDWVREFGSIGIAVGRKALAGKGFGREGMAAMITFGFETLGLHRLEVRVGDKNLKSLQMCASCGYIVEGYLRDAERIKGEWEGVYVMGILDHEYWRNKSRRR